MVSKVSVDFVRLGLRPPAPLDRKVCFQEGDVGDGSDAAADERSVPPVRWGLVRASGSAIAAGAAMGSEEENE